jgi:hypothetical protein
MPKFVPSSFMTHNNILRPSPIQASRDINKATDFVNEYCSRSNIDVVIKGGEDAYAQIIEGDFCDAVYIPLPTTLHKEWVIRALRSGKHVLVEKPVAVNYEDYVEMRQVAFTAKKFIMDGTMFVHNPRTDKFLHCVTDETTFGDIDRIDFTFTFSGNPGFFENDIRVKVDGDPLGCLGDLVSDDTRAVALLSFQLPNLVIYGLHSTSIFYTFIPSLFSLTGLVLYPSIHCAVLQL